MHHISNYYTLINDARATPGTFANETIIAAGDADYVNRGTSAIRQPKKKKKEDSGVREKERNERGTDVTGNLANVDYRYVRCASRSVAEVGVARPPRE